MDEIHESFVTLCLLWLYANIYHPLLLILIVFSSLFLILLILIIAIVIILSLTWLYVRSTFSLSALILYLIEAIEHLYPPQFLLRLRRRVHEPPVKSPPLQAKPKALTQPGSLVQIGQKTAPVQKEVVVKQITNDSPPRYKITPSFRSDTDGRSFMRLDSHRVSRSPSEDPPMIRYRDFIYAKISYSPFGKSAKIPMPRLTKASPKALTNHSTPESSRAAMTISSTSSERDRSRMSISDDDHHHHFHDDDSDDDNDPYPRCLRCNRLVYPDPPRRCPHHP